MQCRILHNYPQGEIKHVNSCFGLVVITFRNVTLLVSESWCLLWKRVHRNPLYLDVVARYLRRMGIRQFQTRLRRVWIRLISHESQVQIYYNRCNADSLSRLPTKTYFQVKHRDTRVSQVFSPSSSRYRSITKLHVPLWLHRGVYWRCKIMHPFQKTPVTSMYKYPTQLDRC